MTTRTHRRHRPRPLFPFAVTLRAVAVIFEGDGRPALYLSTEDHGSIPRVFRVPDDARVTVRAPFHLLKEDHRVFLPKSAVTFETPRGRSVLHLHAVRVCRELLEALEGQAQAVATWQAARAHFDHQAGQRTTDQGAA